MASLLAVSPPTSNNARLGCPGTWSCSMILTRSLPPTKPMAACLRTSASSATISGDTPSRAGVSVPSTSKRQSTSGCVRSGKRGAMAVCNEGLRCRRC